MYYKMLNIYKTKALKKFIADEAPNPNYKNHFMKVNKHCIVCGGTGTGKTNWVANYLRQMINTFAHVYIFAKNTHEPIYEYMKDQMKDACTLETLDKVPSLKELKSYGESLVIFDDFITENKPIIEKLAEYAIMSRKHHCTCLYLVQSYFACQKKIREQCAYVILLALTDKKNLSLITSTLACPVEPSIIKQIIQNATKEQFNVCIIDVQTPDLNRKFRRNFNEFYRLVDDDGEILDKIQLYSGSGVIN